MEITQVTDLMRSGIGVALRIGGPILILSMLVGVVTAIIQAVTQIHEQTISFVLKLAVVIIIMIVGGSWMLTLLSEYALELFAAMKA